MGALNYCPIPGASQPNFKVCDTCKWWEPFNEVREAAEMRELRTSALQQLKDLQHESVPQEHRPLHRAAEAER